jgi:polar amino acid transport system permease protein
MCPDTPVLNFLCQVVTLREHFSWQIVGSYLFRGFIFQAVLLTVGLSVISQLLGTLIGLLLYFMRRSRFGGFRWLANIYIWFFRGTPLLVQILLAYNFFPYLGLLTPLRAINFFPRIGYPQVALDSFLAALLALSLNEGAYMAEIVRAGIDSIDVGQMEAAKSLGMTYFMAMRRIILPQAARVIIPPLGNEFNNMLKSSSLASVIALQELLGTATLVGGPIFRILELYVVASFWYLIMTTIWTFVQAWIERRLNVSTLDTGPTQAGFLNRLLGFGGRAGKPEIAAQPVGTLPTDRGAR